jgi:uncharacterized protein (DUF1499 family)
MARRRIADEPMSRLAIWARRCALFSFIATLMAVLIVRSGLLDLEPALATFGAALLLSVIGIVLALGAFIVVWKDGISGAGYAFTAIAIGAALLAYPTYLGIRAYQLPMINDITTDPLDPPRFDVLARLRPRGTVEYAGLYAAEQQREAYSDIEPLTVTATPQVAYDATLALILRRKWNVISDRPPGAGRRDGLIEAVARTPVMGFRDDVSVRVRPSGDGVRIDVRSASRYGRHDFGTNASRVRSLLEDVDERIGARTASEEQRPQQQQQQKQQPRSQPARR